MDRKHIIYAAALLALFLLTGVSPARASQIAAGYEFTMAIMADGSLSTWGSNSSGQLGNGTTGTSTSTDTPGTLTTSETWSAVAAGPDFGAAIALDGTLWTWGDNTSGELGKLLEHEHRHPGPDSALRHDVFGRVCRLELHGGNKLV